MVDILGALLALSVVVLPLALAGWLLGRPRRDGTRRQDQCGKMSSLDGDDGD